MVAPPILEPDRLADCLEPIRFHNAIIPALVKAVKKSNVR